jgi:hypothetical protein
VKNLCRSSRVCGAVAADINGAARSSGVLGNITPSQPRSGLRLRVWRSTIDTIGTQEQYAARAAEVAALE